MYRGPFKQQICGDAGLTALRTLVLGYCGWITDAHLAGLPACLQDLNMEYCELITSDGIRCHLAGKPLTSLCLSRCPAIDDKIFRTLRRMPLVNLNLTWHEDNFTYSSLKGLLLAVPSIKIVKFDFSSFSACYSCYKAMYVYGQASDRWRPPESKAGSL